MSVCKKHPSETAAGVCAPCLRDRLHDLPSCVTPRTGPPSSVHKEQDNQLGDHIRPLFIGEGPSPLQGKKAGFSVLTTLFSTPGGVPSPLEERSSRLDYHHRLDQAPAVPPSFSSWLAALFTVRCKRMRLTGRMESASDTRGAISGDSLAASSELENKIDTPTGSLQRATCRLQKYRGMSPRSEQGEDEEPQHEEGEEIQAAVPSPSGSGSSCSTSGGQPGHPGPTPELNTRRRNNTALTTGFAVCFSPLVHARPQRHPSGGVVAGNSGGGHYRELQKPRVRLRRHGQHQHQHHHHSLQHGGGGGGGVKLGPNRSRKLVDFGRFQ